MTDCAVIDFQIFMDVIYQHFFCHTAIDIHQVLIWLVTKSLMEDTKSSTAMSCLPHNSLMKLAKAYSGDVKVKMKLTSSLAPGRS